MEFRGDMFSGDDSASRTARQALIDLNQQTLDRLKASLTDVDADALTRAYDRKAWPDVFRDPASAEPQITAALALPDLSAPQRQSLQQIASEYRVAYDDICQAMIDLARTAPAMEGPGGGGGRDWQAFQERMRQSEKLNFDREDLNVKTIERLKLALTDEQVARIGGLASRQTE